MIKILYIISSLGAGGKERQLFEIIKSIDKNLFQIKLITFKKNQHYYDDIIKTGIDIFVLKKRPTRLEPLFNIWAVIKKYKPNIIHTFDSLSSFYSYLPIKYFGIKFIDGSIRDSGVDKGFLFQFKRYFLNSADYIIANSEAGLKYYKVNGAILYNIVDKNRFIERRKNDKFNIIMTANFTDYKDYKTFIDASAKLIMAKIIDNAFMIGDGPNRNYFENYVKLNYSGFINQIHFLGKVKEVEYYLKDCSIGILCSTSRFGEGLSNAILEYIAAGLVPIATRIGGNAEIINHGVNGFLIAENDSNDLYELVKFLKSNEGMRESMAKNNKTILRNKFDKEKVITKLQNIYLNLNKNKY